MFRGIACFDECHPEKIFTYLAKAVWLFFANQDSEPLVRPCWFFGLDSFSQLGDSYLAEWSCSIVITWISHLIDLGCFFHVKPGYAWDISGYFWFIIHLLLLEGRSFFYCKTLRFPLSPCAARVSCTPQSNWWQNGDFPRCKDENFRQKPFAGCGFLKGKLWSHENNAAL